MSRARRLDTFATSSLSHSGAELDRAAAHVALEYFTLWDGFIRSHCLAVLAGAHSSRGFVTASNAGRCKTAKDSLIEVYKARNPHKAVPTKLTHRDEPDWFDDSVILQLSQALAFTNDAAIRAAIAIPGSWLPVLRALRNYYAHKGEGTYTRLATATARAGFPPIADPASLLLRINPVSHSFGYRAVFLQLQRRVTLIC